MTEEELDNLASAYVDGEATPEEMAIVEDDPVLSRRVAEFRSVSARISANTQSPVPVLPDVRQSQIAAAMAGFGVAADPVVPDVIDLSQRRQQQDRSPTVPPVVSHPQQVPVESSSDSGGQVQSFERRRRNALPAWLGAAAVFAIAMGGFALATRDSNSNDTASVDVTDAEMADTADQKAADDLVEPNVEASSDDADDDDSFDADAALAGNEVPLDREDAYDADEDLDDSEDSGAEPSPTAGQEPGSDTRTLFSMDSVDLVELAGDPTVPWSSPVDELCQAPVGISVVGRLAGVLLVEVGGQRFEVLLYTEDGGLGSVDDARSLFLVDGSCEVIDSNI